MPAESLIRDQNSSGQRGKLANNGSSSKVIRVIVADDHPVVREHILRLLAGAKDISVVGEARNGYEALQLGEDLKPDILLLDLEMPDMNGVLVAKKIKAVSPDVKILILSGYCEKDFIKSVLAYQVNGYIVKDDAPDSLISALREVASNGQDIQWLSKRVIELLQN